MATVHCMLLALAAATASGDSGEHWQMDSSDSHDEWLPWPAYDDDYYAEVSAYVEAEPAPADCAYECAGGYGHVEAVMRLADEHRGCISAARVCDGEFDCVDGADEMPETCEEYGKEGEEGSYDMFNGQEPDKYADESYADYVDKEEHRGNDCTYKCAGGYVYPFDHYIGCIKEHQVCDGVVHCKGGDDESAQQCTADMKCPKGRFVCWSRRLVHGSNHIVRQSTPVCADEGEYRCDGEAQCDDGADEEGC